MAEKIIDTDRIINSLNQLRYTEEDIFQLDKIVGIIHVIGLI